MPRTLPYGTWPSPVTLDRLTDDVVRLEWPVAVPGRVYWAERRPAEAGRTALVAADVPGGEAVDAVPAGFDARTLVHEYGGRPFAAHGGVLYVSSAGDQRLYRVEAGSDPTPLTPPPPEPRSVRYATPVVTPARRWVYAVRERHHGGAGEVENDVVAIGAGGAGEPVVAASGHDFYNHVVVSASGDRLAWIHWDHPDMPWDASELWEAALGPDGLPVAASAVRVAGGPGESVTQPAYGPDGRLYFVSDRTGWWNLYAAATGGAVALGPMAGEIGGADWVLGLSSYAVLADGRIVAAWTAGGLGHLGILVPGATAFVPLATPFTTFGSLRPGTDGTSIVAVAGSPTDASCVVRIAFDGTAPAIDVLRRSHAHVVDRAYLSHPRPVEFPTTGGERAHGLYYAPCNPEAVAPAGEAPPLIVRSHGGPTTAASSTLDYPTQLWTSRGFAVIDVNYRGSTGYGREYRERLYGGWGVVDVDDCLAAAGFLAATGRADPDRLLARGSSAGGFTTLCALTFRTGLRAGASCYGVGDVAALARDTHKFESRYNDRLIGPWPATAARYEARSPARHAGLLRTPTILFQGLDDRVVPPVQAEALAAALRANGVPHAYVAYPGEGHGFRQAAHIRRTAEAELYFYCRVLGLVPADHLDPVDIVHADRIGE